MPDNLESCAAKLRRFAGQSCQGESPLYEHLCSQAADDERLLRLVQATPVSQPVPNLFLAAIHFLLLSGADAELRDYYGSCTPDPQPPGGAFLAFRDFCLAREAEIRELMRSRRVQTNEVRRCSYLLPAFGYVARQAGPRPLALIEVGASAGLNLIWDRYAYDYGAGLVWGPREAKVRISAELQGDRRIPLPEKPPSIASRAGVDLHVLDMASREDAVWLQSLVWPDQAQRMQLLTAAIEELRSDPPKLVEGDALDVLPPLIRQAPRHALVCVFHCHTLNQFTGNQRDAFAELLRDASRDRPLVQLSAEWIFTPTTELRRTWWEQGGARVVHLANVHQHGRWIEWRQDA